MTIGTSVRQAWRYFRSATCTANKVLRQRVSKAISPHPGHLRRKIMATKKKKPARSERDKGKGDQSAKAARESDGVLRTNDIVAEQASASDALVAAVPYNSTKGREHGRDNAVAPPPGETVAPDSRALTASTSTEESGTEKAGGAASQGTNATVASLERVRSDASDQPLPPIDIFPATVMRQRYESKRRPGILVSAGRTSTMHRTTRYLATQSGLRALLHRRCAHHPHGWKP